MAVEASVIFNSGEFTWVAIYKVGQIASFIKRKWFFDYQLFF